MERKFLPVILGSDENAYGFSRAFYEVYGIKPTLICRQRLVATQFSRIVNIEQADDFDTPEVFIKKLTEFAANRKEDLLLIPCSDRYTELAVKHRDELSRYYKNKFISEDLLNKFITKEKFYALCDEYNLRYPKTVICTYENRLTITDNLPFDFPIVVKANNSNGYEFLNCSFEGKKKVFFVNSKEEYIKIITEMNKSTYKDNLILQEFIPGDDTNMRVMNCYSDSEGKVKLMCLGRPILEEYTPAALGNYTAIVTDYDEKLYAKIKIFLEDIGYVGFSNFDLKYDAKNKEYVLFEINPRQGRSSFFVTAAGYNLAEFLARDVIYGEKNPTVYGKNEHLWISVPKKVLLKYIFNDEVAAQVKRLLKEKKYDYTLFYKKDFNILRYIKMKRYVNRHYEGYKKYFFRKDMGQ